LLERRKLFDRALQFQSFLGNLNSENQQRTRL